MSRETKWRCFWFDGELGADASEPEPATLEEISERMAKILVEPTRTFVGIVDERGVVLQFAGQRDGSVLMEIPIPALQGSWHTSRSLASCLEEVAKLEGQSCIEMAHYPDMVYRLWFPGSHSVG